MNGLVWSFRPVVQQKFKFLYRNSSLLDTRFSVTEYTQTGQIILHIQETSAEDAGLYRCLTAYGEYTAHLVIIGKLLQFPQYLSKQSPSNYKTSTASTTSVATARTTVKHVAAKATYAIIAKRFRYKLLLF